METALSVFRTYEDRIDITRRLAVRSAFVVLLAAETVFLTIRFDAQALVEGGRWWGSLLSLARYMPHALIAVGAAAAVIARPGFGAELIAGRAVRDRGGWPWLFLGLHLAAFATLALLTKAVWEGPLGRSPFAVGWAIAWVAAAVATSIFWLAALLPATAWAELARKGVGVAAAASVVGAGAVLAGSLTGAFWKPLGILTLWTVRGLLQVFSRDLVFDPAESVVGTSAFSVEIASGCSGYEGIGLILVFLTAYLWYFRRTLRFPQAFWLLPLGTVVMWAANAARITALVVIGTHVSSTVALGGFHSQAGWLAFNVVALGLVLVSRRARIFAVTEAQPAVLDNPTAAYLAPLLALVGTVMATAAFQGAGRLGFDVAYPLRVVAVALTRWAFRSSYKGLRPAWSWSSLAIGAAVFALWMALEPAASKSATEGAALAEGLARLPRWLGALWLVGRVVGSVVTVPIAEELAFRGYLSRRLIAADFTAVPAGRLTWTSFLVSSVLFGAFHGRFLAGVLAGMLYALAFRLRGRLGDAVLAHAVTNALIAAYVLATGAWGLWV